MGLRGEIPGELELEIILCLPFETGGAERSLVVTTASAKIPAPAPGSVIAVRALGVNGTEGWDWSTVTLPGEAR